MEKRFDVIALGELLIDFTENGQSEQGNPLLEANPGGAPCNVLAMLQKLGKRTAFIGKVGKDMFGKQLREAAEGAGICMDFLLEDEYVHTTLAFVKTFPNGDRDFSFYRDPGADMMLRADELPLEVLQGHPHLPLRHPVHDPPGGAAGDPEGCSPGQGRRGADLL